MKRRISAYIGTFFLTFQSCGCHTTSGRRNLLHQEDYYPSHHSCKKKYVTWHTAMQSVANQPKKKNLNSHKQL